MQNIQWRLPFSIVVMLLLSGCAGLGVQSDAERLMERAEAYWQARELRDARTIFELESAAEPRGSLTPLGAARIGQGVALSNVKVTDPEIDGDTAEVKVAADVRYTVMARFGSKVFRQQVPDLWVRIDGDWYHKTHRVRSLGAIKREREERMEREKRQGGDREEREAAGGGGEQ